MAHEPTNPTGFPDVTDDAADSPMWLPGLGIALFVLAALYMTLAGSASDTSGQVLEIRKADTAPAGEVAEPSEAAAAADGAPIEFEIVEDDAH